MLQMIAAVFFGFLFARIAELLLLTLVRRGHEAKMRMDREDKE